MHLNTLHAWTSNYHTSKEKSQTEIHILFSFFFETDNLKKQNFVQMIIFSVRLRNNQRRIPQVYPEASKERRTSFSSGKSVLPMNSMCSESITNNMDYLSVKTNDIKMHITKVSCVTWSHWWHGWMRKSNFSFNIFFW